MRKKRSGLIWVILALLALAISTLSVFVAFTPQIIDDKAESETESESIETSDNGGWTKEY